MNLNSCFLVERSESGFMWLHFCRGKIGEWLHVVAFLQWSDGKVVLCGCLFLAE